MSTYYSAPPAVVDGDIAYAADVNDISTAVDAAFSTVESEISGLPATVQFWATKAENWAEKAEDSQVESGKYSAKHHAAKASASAASASGSAGTAIASAGSATSSASSASISAGTATTQAGTATTQAGIATTKATLAAKYAQEAENTEVETGTYSAYHWSKKSQAYAATTVATVTGTGVNNTDPRNPVISITASTIGLGNVNNTSDVNKPVSSAQQNALDLKANLASPTFTGTPAGPTATVGTNTTQLATTAFVIANAPSSLPGIVSGVNIEGNIYGLNITTSGQIITITTGSCMDSTGEVNLELSSSDTIDVTGTGNNTEHYICLVKLTGGSIDTKRYSTYAAIESDVGVNITHYRLISWAINNGSGSLMQYSQIGDNIFYTSFGTGSPLFANVGAAYAVVSVSAILPISIINNFAIGCIAGDNIPSVSVSYDGGTTGIGVSYYSSPTAPIAAVSQVHCKADPGGNVYVRYLTLRR